MRCQADAATTRRLGVSPGRRILPSLSYRCVIVDDGNGPSCSEAFRQIRRVYRIRYFSDDSASIYWWRGEGGGNKRRKISIHGLFVYTSLRNMRRKDEEELEI